MTGKLFNRQPKLDQFIFFFFVICSLHLSFMHGCLGNIQWRAPTGLVSCCNLMFREFHAYWRFLSLSRFSLSLQFTSLEIKSLFLRLKSCGSSPFRKRRPARHWSFTGLRSCIVSNSCFAFRLNAMASSSWQRDSILRLF